MLPPLSYADDVELIPVDEPQDTDLVLRALGELLQDHGRVTGRRQRDVHVKSHGCATGVLQVEKALPDELAQGLFRGPRAYDVVVRFSNSSPYLLPDVVPDGRGVAMRVSSVTGEFLPRPGSGVPTQDFLLANHPVFLAEDVKDYLRLQKIRLALRRQPVTALTQSLTDGHWNPQAWRWRAALSSARVLSQGPRHPAQFTYFSMVPFRFGKFVAKFRLKPAFGPYPPPRGLLLKAVCDANAMSTALRATLKQRPFQFEFQVQLRTCASTMPIENATVGWPEDKSSYRTVAVLTILPQDMAASPFGSGDALAFNVWNALADHRPLGGINRLRREAYQRSADWRQGSSEQSPIDTTA